MGLPTTTEGLLATPQHCCGVVSVSFRSFFFFVFAFLPNLFTARKRQK